MPFVLSSLEQWLDRYAYSPLDSLTGEGGSVYKALDKTGGEWVAVKLQTVHRQWAGELFEERCRLLPDLQHPNLLPYTEARCWTEEGDLRTLALAMPLIEGGSLDRYEHLTREQRSDLTEGVLSALAYLHERGIVHQRLCAEHILVQRVGEVLLPRLINYGNAGRLPLAFERSYEYLAPEQFDEQAAVGKAADIWAFGVLLFWLWTGTLPFGRRSASMPNAKIRERILERPIPAAALQELPALIQQMLRLCLEKAPERRANSAANLLQFYQEEKHGLWLEQPEQQANKRDESKQAERLPIWQRRVRRRPSRPIAWHWAVLLVLGAALAGWAINRFL